MTFALIIAATAANGHLSGATLDQSIKQLPARHHIGSIAYTKYARAADGGNGVIWYAMLGIGTALLTILAALSVFYGSHSFNQWLPLLLSAAGSNHSSLFYYHTSCSYHA